ncbi:recombination, repair and ssDNA binding protein [Pectobacterium phage POP12]|nr:recombination, repair and ssDNA binding protein [Pectobacterium phage POP12]
MKLEELQVELENDMIIDGTKLQYEASQIPVIWSKWLRHHSNVKKKLIQLEAKRKQTIRERMEYYTGRGDQICETVYERSELKIVISGDNSVVEIDKLIQYFEMLAEFTGKSLDIIKTKGFSIKNMIEIRNLESGK